MVHCSSSSELREEGGTGGPACLSVCRSNCLSLNNNDDNNNFIFQNKAVLKGGNATEIVIEQLIGDMSRRLNCVFFELSLVGGLFQLFL